jgi:hypothetical protein
VSFFEQFLHGSLDIPETGLVQRLASQQDRIPTGRQRPVKRLEGRTKAAFTTVALDGASHRPAGDNRNMGWIKTAWNLVWDDLPGDNQHNKRVSIRLTHVPHPLDFGRPGQTKLTFHPKPCIGKVLIFFRLPANAFNVVIHGDRKMMATTQAAALDNLAPICSRHAGPESMHSQAAMNLRLISAFYHLLNILSMLHFRHFIIH